MKSQKKLKTIYHVFYEEYGEHDVFFDEDLDIIDYWHCNDANWRGEYFQGLVAYMGYEVIQAEGDPEARKRFEDLLIKNGQLDEDERFET